MEENTKKFQCSGNCLKCSQAQMIYCASQHALSNMKVLDSLMSIVIGLSDKIDAMQNAEAEIFDPNESEIAHEGSGAK